MWRLRRRRFLALGFAALCLVYILRTEIANSYDNKRQKDFLYSDLATKPIVIEFDFERYLAAERLTESNDFAKHSFSQKVSDATHIDRILPDSRHPSCKGAMYSIPSSYTVSVVISFHNEARSALLRTIVSILNRTPDRLLKEIVLVDDCSNDMRDGQELVTFPKVKVIRNNQRQGLARSRMFGVQKATGNHVIFLDSHCEVNVDWLPPLLQTAYEHPKALLSPVIDIIDAETFQYMPSSGELKGGFDWTLNYHWQPASEKEGEDPSESASFKSPVIQGGLFLANKTWFNELGGLDRGLDVWGLENIEVSIKAWLCGGEILTVPCSRIGHVFRNRHPYSFPPNGSLPTYLRNARRIAEAWMDEYKYQFYDVKPQAKTQAIGSIEGILSLKRKLKCKPFQWYLTNVYPELKPASKDALALGQLEQENMCLQSTTAKGKLSVHLALCGSGVPEQDWLFAKSEELRQGNLCLTVKLSMKKPKVYLTKCNDSIKQKWSRRRRLLLHQGLCLEKVTDSLVNRTYLTLNPCRQKAVSQQWDFSVELQSWGDR